MLVGVPAETAPGERRAALVPETVKRLVASGVAVLVQRGAGVAAAFSDAAYEAAGATLAADAADLYARADVVAKVARPDASELARLRPGTVLVAFLAPLGDPAYVEALAARGVWALSMDAIPRTTRAQSMDALSSQANIAGYKAAVIAAEALPRFFPMLTTAAGTIPPAKVLVLGAGVAGLQAIATARRLGAVVSAYDTRAAVAEQIRSLGATFVELDLRVDAEGAGGYARALDDEQTARQQHELGKRIAQSDVVISTAAVPGKSAPRLITEAAVRSMKPGSVIVDLAAESGGNCALTRPGETIVVDGVTIVGTRNLPSTLATHASQLYARNVHALLAHLVKDGSLRYDETDEITTGTTIARDGVILHAPTLAALGRTSTHAPAPGGPT